MDQQDERLFSNGLLKKTFDHLPWGIVKANKDEEITYADRQMCEIAGANTLEGRTIRDLFPDDDNYNKVAQQFKNRFIGQRSDEYKVELTRIKDRVTVPISIMAFPDIDRKGKVIESIGIVRSLVLEKVAESMHHCIETSRDWQKILKLVAQEVNKLVPFDLFSVLLYSNEKSHLRRLFSYSRGEEIPSQVRWYEMKQWQRELVEQQETMVIDDLEEWLDSPERAEVRKEDEVKKFLKQGYHSNLAYPVIREGRVIASICLYKKTKQAFTQEHRKMLASKDLPLSNSVLMALYYKEKKDFEFRLQLIQKLSFARNVCDIANVIVQEMSEHYQWDIISLYQVCEELKQIRLLSHQKQGFLIAKTYFQPINSGILGYVYKNKNR